MQPNFTKLVYRKNAITDIFSNFIDQPWSMLLHSGYNNNHNHRFDILVANPTVKITSKNGVTKITRKNKSFFSKNDPFMIINQEILKEGILINQNNEFPFLGGAIGFFSYDLIRNIIKLPNISINDINMPDLAIGIYYWTIIADNFKQKLTLINYDNVNFPLEILKKNKNTKFKSFNITRSWKTNMSYNDYVLKFKKIREYLFNGECYQICLSQRFDTLYEGDEWTMFLKLLSYSRAPFSAFIKIPKYIIMSFSPEHFLSINNKIVTTKPIKGTIKKLKNSILDNKQIYKLFISKKNRTENVMIVDLLRNDLGKIAYPGSVNVISLYNIETFNALHHMISTISATVDDKFSECDVLRSCFPGGSITGVPKIRAMEIIDELEPNRRNAWCGNIGYISFCKKMHFNIAIRTLLTHNNKIYYYAGGGIIIDSKVEEEYKETLLKASSILNFLK